MQLFWVEWEVEGSPVRDYTDWGAARMFGETTGCALVKEIGTGKMISTYLRNLIPVFNYYEFFL